MEGRSHHGDAEVATLSFRDAFPRLAEASSVTAANPYSLIGAALLRPGLATDPGLLSTPCVVIRS